MIVCPKCETQLTDNAIFCENCGTRIEPTPQPVPQPTPEPISLYRQLPKNDDADKENLQEPFKEEPAKPQKSKVYILHLIYGIVCLILIIVIIMLSTSLEDTYKYYSTMYHREQGKSFEQERTINLLERQMYAIATQSGFTTNALLRDWAIRNHNNSTSQYIGLKNIPYERFINQQVYCGIEYTPQGTLNFYFINSGNTMMQMPDNMSVVITDRYGNKSTFRGTGGDRISLNKNNTDTAKEHLYLGGRIQIAISVGNHKITHNLNADGFAYAEWLIKQTSH